MTTTSSRRVTALSRAARASELATASSIAR